MIHPAHNCPKCLKLITRRRDGRPIAHKCPHGKQCEWPQSKRIGHELAALECPDCLSQGRAQNVATFRRVVRAMTKEEKPGSLLAVRVVRERTGLPKSEFDTIALGLERTGELVLHFHDFPEALSALQLEQLIKGPKGIYYIGLALPTNDPG